MGDSWPKIFLPFALAFIAGIFFASFGAELIGIELLLVMVSVSLLLVGFLQPLAARKIFILSGFLIASLALGVARYNLDIEVKESWLDKKIDQKVTITGIVTAEPDERDKETRLLVSPSGEDKKILVITTRYPIFRYGDQLKLTGKLQQPKNFSTAGGPTFDYLTYLAKDDIYYEVYLPKIFLLSRGKGFWLTEQTLVVKKLFLDSLSRTLPEPESSYLAGLLLGAKRGLGKAIQTDFQRAGLSHVLVLSGYNITVVAGSVARVLSFLPLLWSGFLSILVILLFGVAAGGGATVWRASAMAIIAIYAKLSGRLYNISTALLLTASLLLWLNPRLLFFDLSFQLSFLATLGVVYGAKIFQSWFLKVPEWYQLKDTLCTTLGALVFVLPLILYKTGLLSTLALPANLLILPLIPTTMFFGFWTVALDLVSGHWLAPLSYLIYLLLKVELAVVHFVAGLPFSALMIPPWPFWLISFIYLIFTLVVIGLYPKAAKTP
ncbi:MAG: ComEC/Rec2 family competence protein [Patescibacteria group bacterium]